MSASAARRARRAAARKAREASALTELQELEREVKAFVDRVGPPEVDDPAHVVLCFMMRAGIPQFFAVDLREDREAAQMLSGLAEAPPGFLRVILLARDEGKLLAVRWRNPADVINAPGGVA